LLSFVYTSESILALATSLDDDPSFAWIESLENSENSTESEESKEQKKKVDFLTNFYFHTQLSLAQIGTISLDSHHAINFISDDHSMTIYSPPEELG
jgi:hypothetical protein